MTDDTKDTEIDDDTAASAEPDFSPITPAPALDDDAVDDDPHASFDPIVAPDEDALDPYGVGAPKSDEDYEDDEDELDEEGYDTMSSDAY
jgi:hypothetical protein